MKKSMKVISILLMAVMLISTISTVCFATKITNEVSIDMDAAEPADTTNIAKKAANLVATIRNVAAIAAVVIVAILGVKYMLGSVEEKAEYKKSFVPLIVGVVVVTMSLQIAAMIFGMAGD